MHPPPSVLPGPVGNTGGLNTAPADTSDTVAALAVFTSLFIVATVILGAGLGVVMFFYVRERKSRSEGSGILKKGHYSVEVTSSGALKENGNGVLEEKCAGFEKKAIEAQANSTSDEMYFNEKATNNE